MSKSLQQRIERLERILTPPHTATASNTFGARLRVLRQSKGMSQSDVITKVKIAKGYLSELENDKRAPGADVLYRLAQAFGVSMDYLWTGR